MLNMVDEQLYFCSNELLKLDLTPYVEEMKTIDSSDLIGIRKLKKRV